MGLKDLFSSKRVIDRINKYFIDSKITLERNNEKYCYELFLSESGYSLYPYFILSEDESEASFIINVRKIENEENNLEKINSFNIRSKYFKAILRNNSIYLEYNTAINSEMVKDIFTKLTESVFSLQEDIDKL